MKVEEESTARWGTVFVEEVLLVSNANCGLFFVNFDIGAVNLKTLEGIPHFWYL